MPHFDLEWGVSEAWKIMAGNGARLHDTQGGGDRQSRSQIVANCLEMAKEWKERTLDSVQVTASAPHANTLPVANL